MRARASRVARAFAAASAGTDCADAPSWSISRCARSIAAACSVPAAGTWLRRSRAFGGAAADDGPAPAPVPAPERGGLAEPPFVIVIDRRPSSSCRRSRSNKKPSPSGEGPVGLRWFVALLAPVPPRSSVLPPGAGNEAKEALNAEQERANKGEQGYLERTVLERHLHAPAIARHDDGDGAAIQTVRGAHGPRSLRCDRSMCNHAGGTVDTEPGIRTTAGGPTVVQLHEQLDCSYRQRCPESRSIGGLAMAMGSSRTGRQTAVSLSTASTSAILRRR